MKYSILALFFCVYLNAQKRAVFIKPVTDLCTRQICNDTAFASLDMVSCHRSHQALFNEVCYVLAEKKDAIQILLPNVIYTKKPGEQSTFWAPRSALLLINHKYAHVFPAPISITTVIGKNTLVLVMPFEDPVTKKTYSAGTRFVRHAHKDTKKNYGIKLYNAQHKKVALTRVPKNIARIESSISPEQAQRDFVQLLYSWAQLKQGVIPYVWGGSSFIYTQQDGTFFADEHSNVYYENRLPAFGYDCSELILRAAQISGIPYFCKVTAVIPEYLKELRKGEKLSEGDLLWHSGHVMVVGNIQRNELVESRGYITKYGKVQVIELNKIFEGVNTYDDLLQKYYTKTPLKLLYQDGTLYKLVTDFKIFKLSSVWPARMP